MDLKYVLSLIPVFMGKLPFTLCLVLLTFVLGFILALFITLGRIRKLPVLGVFLECYVSFIRSIPSILLLFLVYYGLPWVVKTLLDLDINSVDKLVFGITSMVLFNGGHMSEILRASFAAIDQDQIVLAKSLGYGFPETVFLVVLPQAISIAMPDLENTVINVMKDSALLFTIGITDLMSLADIYVGNSYGVGQAEIYLAVGSIYILCASLIYLVFRGLERLMPMARIREGKYEND